jgi:SAM-dependent methyltransferase
VPADSVTAHYSRADIIGALRRALEGIGRTPADVQLDELAPFDQFHLRGLPATLELLALSGVRQGERLLDLGGGVGGSARIAASRLGCHVTVVDLSPAYVEAGIEITRWFGLDGRVRFLVGDATAPPVPDASFDVVWTQHASMNIADKRALYHAAARALVPGGRFALHDVMGGDRMEELEYPVPWASSAALSALMHADEQRRLILEAGFTERAWHDVTRETHDWLAERLASPTRSPVGLQLLLGDSIRDALANVLRNMAAGRVRVIQAVFD